MFNNIKKIAIIGNSGFAKEIAYSFHKNSYDFFVNKEFLVKDDHKTKAIEDINFDKYKILLGIGDPIIRKKIVDNLPKNVEYMTYIDKHAKILDKETINIGKGVVICAGAILTTHINLGDFGQINLNSTIGHDCDIGNFFTTAPGVHVSGNTNIGNLNYYGTNTALRNNINITDNVTIGMNSNVIKDINESGIYVGNPLKKIR
jgi:sugar O-acyltransferase (sialic acid O-acetyltransferase NeuD family)